MLRECVCYVCYVCCYVRKKALFQCLTERRDMGVYEVPLSISLLGFVMGPRGPMCFRCLMFSLSGPCELLF